MKFSIESVQDMERFGAEFSPVTPPGCTIFLCGELGAGKTTWVRGFLRAKSYRGPVKSPTYTLLEPYSLAECSINHFDFYRLADPEEFDAAGLRDEFDGKAICLVEWPERVGESLPAPDLSVRIAVTGTGRSIELVSHGDQGEVIRKHLAATWKVPVDASRGAHGTQIKKSD